MPIGVGGTGQKSTWTVFLQKRLNREVSETSKNKAAILVLSYVQMRFISKRKLTKKKNHILRRICVRL